MPHTNSIQNDFSFLRDLAASDPDTAREFVRMAQADLQMRFDLIPELVRLGNTSEIGELAHACKSVAGQLGALVLQNKIRDLELASKKGEKPEILETLYKNVEEEFRLIQATINAAINTVV